MINLLPPEQKEELFQEQRYKLLLIWGMSVMIFLIAVSLLLFSIEMFISGKVGGGRVAVSSEIQDSEKEIMKINKDLEDLNSFYANQSHFGGLLDKISQMLPPNVYLGSLILSFSEKEDNFLISLRGVSPSREALSQLKRNLESESIFKAVDFPPANWVEPENIEFNINFKAEAQ